MSGRQESLPEAKLRILILNWRDVRHPRAGGAEFHTHELALRLMQGGAEVEWFAASFPGAAKSEIIDGVRVVRRGRQWTVHLRAFQHYRESSAVASTWSSIRS